MAPTAERLRAAGIGSDRDISTLADLARMPFSFKSDLRDQSPDGLFAVPMEQIVRIHASSGTRGKPTVVGYTRADLGIWSEVMARCLTMAGVRPGTVVHNACGYSLFTGGLGIHQGAELIGLVEAPAPRPPRMGTVSSSSHAARCWAGTLSGRLFSDCCSEMTWRSSR